MSGARKALYDTDFAEWRTVTAELIRAGRFAEIDAARLAEEIEDLPPALCPFDWGDVLPPMSSRKPAKNVKKTKGVV